MMRKGLFLLCLLMSVTFLKAQFNNDFLYYEKYGTSINLHAEYELNSTAIQNDFIDKFIYGGHIDRATKAHSQKRLQAQNRIGGNYFAGATAFFGSKKVEMVNASFSEDAFNLGFYGNKMYEGKTANIGNININQYKYQEIK